MEPPVSIRGLTKRYGSLTAVDALDLQVRSGEVYGFPGPNGAGKTTTLRMLLGLIRPTSGSVRLSGAPPGNLERVGALVEGPAFYPYLTGRENLRAMARHARVGADRIALARPGRSHRAGQRPVRDLLARHEAAARDGRRPAQGSAAGGARRVGGGQAALVTAGYLLVFAALGGMLLHRRDIL